MSEVLRVEYHVQDGDDAWLEWFDSQEEAEAFASATPAAARVVQVVEYYTNREIVWERSK